MKRFYSLIIVAVLLLGAETQAQSLLHYWNFNNSATLLSPTSSMVSGASITVTPGPGGADPSEVILGDNTDLNTNLNGRNGDLFGTHMRFNMPIGGNLVFNVPSTGFQDVIIKYAVARSGSGAGSEKIYYSVNGTDYTLNQTFPVVVKPGSLVTIDLSAVPEADNNPNLKIKIEFEQGAGGAVGNNRIDNFTVEGATFGSDTNAPTVLFSPANGTINMPVNVSPSFTFNEDIRLINDVAIDDSNVDALVELKLNDASGANVAFDATINGKNIILTPDVALANFQKYYVALKANVVEDLSNNAITAVKSFTFTTIAAQPDLKAGDIVFVAYRTSSTVPDEVSFITFVELTPGTLINFTDGKFNNDGQCAGGLTWMSPDTTIPAMSLVSIGTDGATTDKGTLTGSGFGLSSGGDQVIVYTGTNINPKYITAISSNAWVPTAESLTVCNGSKSKLPAGLADGTSSLSTSTAPGNTGGVAINAFYNGSRTGSVANLRASILNPANWVAVGGDTAPQAWPAWGPVVTSASAISTTKIQLTFGVEMDATTANDEANYTGIAGLTSAVLSEDKKTVTLTYANAFVSGESYSLVVANVESVEGFTMSNYTFNFTYSTSITFDKKFISVLEDAGNAVIKLKLSNPTTSTVKLVLKAAPYSTASANDFTYVTKTLEFDGSSTAEQTVTIPIINDTEKENDEYFVLTLEDQQSLTLGSIKTLTVYIKDNDDVAPVATKSIELKHITSFEAVAGDGTAEIVMHDPVTQRLFIVSSIQDRLDIADFSDPSHITLYKSIDMAPYGGITSVAVKNSVVAIASPAVNDQDNGQVVFLDTEGELLNRVTVGVLPDMVTFTPDGTKVMTANEGQPNADYSQDAEGSVSIIDITGGIRTLDQSKVTTLLFTEFNAKETELINAGVRKLKSTSTFSQDFEPEYITISADSKKAWVTLQENNAIAEINLETKTYTSIWPLGKKDHMVTGAGLDASDNSGLIHISNWPVKSFYIPDGVTSFKVGNTQYLMTANEGDEKEYSGFTERTTVGAVTLDAAKFPHAAFLKEDHNLGRLRMTNLSGDTDGDGDYDEINVVGGRSFTIWNAETKQKVYDSGDDFERITSTDPTVSAIFNADNESNAFKSRSRAKGPEPEGITVAQIGDKTYAFIGLERIGGVMVYDVTDPAAPKFVDYKNTRSTTEYAGDHGPEGIIYISREDSPNGKAYVAVANEISGTVSLFEVMGAPKLEPLITLQPIASRVVGEDFELNATSTAELPIEFTSANDKVTIEGKLAHAAKAGKATITASQEASDDYEETSATQTFCINPVKPTITMTGESTATISLQSSATEGNQWFKDETAIAGATGQSYAPTAAGVYYVVSTVEECSSLSSDIFPVIVTGDIKETNRQLNIAPNPADDKIFIQLPGNGYKQIRILNSNGIEVATHQSSNDAEFINVGEWSRGLYIVHVKTSTGVHVGKFIRK